MTNFDRSIISIIVVLAVFLALREGEHQLRLRQRQPAIVVSVTGAVCRPGVIELPASARAVHAIDRCGGLSASADPAALQLAKPLRDGDHLVVPALQPISDEAPLASPPLPVEGLPEPAIPAPPVASPAEPPVVRPVEPARERGVSQAPSPREVDVNRASVDDFDSLPGIGPVLARRIVEARQSAPGGTFASLEELAAIRGIKAKTFSRLKPYLKIEGS